MYRLRFCTSATALFMLFASVCNAAEPIDLRGLKEDLESVVAKRLIDLIKGESQSAIAVGTFSANDPLNNAGPGIRQALIDALSANKSISIVDKASVILSGMYQIVREKTDPNQIAVLLTLTLVNDFGETLATEKFRIHNNRDLAITAGMTGTIPKDGFKDERNRKIKDQILDPKVFISGSQIKTTATSKYTVEILAKHVSERSNAKARDAQVLAGQAFVPLRIDELFEVVVHNNDSKEVAVALTLDGYSAFEFSDVRIDGKPAYTHYIVAPGEKVEIVGWHKSDSGHDNYLSFLVTEYGKGASAKAAQPSQGTTGVITVAISYTGPPGTRQAGQEVGFGPPRSVEVQKVERSIDSPHEIISVRYAK